VYHVSGHQTQEQNRSGTRFQPEPANG